MAESKRDARIPIRVLAHGKVAVEQTGRREKDQVKSATKVKEGLVQERLFPSEERVGGEIGGHPVPKLFGKEKDNGEK